MAGISRRWILRVLAGLGITGIGSSQVGAEASENSVNEADDQVPEAGQDSSERDGEQYTGDEFSTTAAVADDLIGAIATNEVQNAVVESNYAGVDAQARVFTTGLQGFPREGDSFVVLSTGDASDAPGDPETFVSTDIANGRIFDDYSPDGYDAYDVVDLEVELAVPQGVEGIEFQYKFGSEENPGFIGSEYQDFFEAILSTPDDFANIALIDGKAVTVDQANTVANSPGGGEGEEGSQNPTPPFPDPPDVVYNSVTQLLTARRDISAYQGETISLLFRVADASDAVYDSAVFLDNLRFIGDVEKDLTPVETALSEYREAVEARLRTETEAWARFEAEAIREHGAGYTTGLRDYWGYRADEVNEGNVPADLVSIAETLTNELESAGNIDGDDMGMYAFLDELYDVVDTDDPDPVTIRDYYMGTAAGQSNYLEIDGQTIAERIADFNNGIDDYQSKLTTVLRDEQFTQADVQRIADVIAARADKVRREQAELEESVDDLRQTLVGAEEVDGQFFVQTLETGTAEDLSANALVTGAIGGGIYFAGKAVLGWAAAHSTLLAGSAGVGALGIASYGYLGGSASAGSGLSGVSSQQIVQQQMAQQHLRWKAAKKLSEESAEELSNEILNKLRELATEVEITGLQLPDITEADKVELSLWEKILDILPFVGEETTTVGRQTGTMTIENTGSHPINAPTAGVETKIYSQFTNEFVKSNYQADFSELETVAPINRGESVQVEFEYEVPFEQFGSAFRMSVDLYEAIEYDVSTGYGPNLSPDPLASASGSFTAGETGESLSTDVIAEDVISDGERQSFQYSPAADTNQLIIDVEWDDYYVDLHLYDENGNHTGYDYGNNSVDREIPLSSYSGRSTESGGFEWIAVSDVQSDNYEVEIVAPEVGTVEPDGNVQAHGVAASSVDTTVDVGYQLTETTAPELPADLLISTESMRLKTPPGGVVERDLRFREGNGDRPLTDLVVQPTDLVHEDGAATIDADRISITNNAFDIAPGGSGTTTLQIVTDETLPTGTYTGRLDVQTQSETASTHLAVVVEEPGPSVADYANAQGIVDNDGLQDAIIDWSTGEIGTDLLQDIIAAWASGQPVA